MVTELTQAPLQNDVTTGLGMRQHQPIEVVGMGVHFDRSGRGGSSGLGEPGLRVRVPDDAEDRLRVLPQRWVRPFG
jgi:hypothetical protein